MHISPEDAVRYGADIRRFAESEAFVVAVKALKASYENQFYSTSFGEREAREEAWLKNAALEDLIGVLNTFVAANEQDALYGGHQPETE